VFGLVYIKTVLEDGAASKMFYDASISKMQNSGKEKCLGPIARRPKSTPYFILIEIIRTVLKAISLH